MRGIIPPQLQLGEQDIGAIEIDCRSRDDLPRLLRGLQSIDVTPELRERVFAILAEVVALRSDGTGVVSTETGRPGMTQWQMLVLGTLRLGLNADYECIEELANQHRTVRRMLGHGDWAEEKRWSVLTLKDNLRLFTPEVLDRINQVVVDAGHALVKNSPRTRSPCALTPSVVETDVHLPTDINLLCDAVRKVIETSARLCAQEDLSDWRQSAYNVRCWKRAYRRVRQLKRSTAKDAGKRRAQGRETLYPAAQALVPTAGTPSGRRGYQVVFVPFSCVSKFSPGRRSNLESIICSSLSEIPGAIFLANKNSRETISSQLDSSSVEGNPRSGWYQSIYR